MRRSECGADSAGQTPIPAYGILPPMPNGVRNGILPAGNRFKFMGQWPLNTVVPLHVLKLMSFIIIS